MSESDTRIANKRILIVENEKTNLYVINSLREKFDEVLVISDYLKPINHLTSSEASRLPATIYDSSVTPDSGEYLTVGAFNKTKYAAVKKLDLGENNAYFVVGKPSWYYIRDFLGCHVGLTPSPIR